ncbi:hypothetical protein E3N88_42620 [Mikania micrantha]|uniref:Uncharacterized protein n=1 Tax=Mikania micrantha TaxID=192012 RepID=A0A5N6LI46_9ASTR|nr:hypothetical protein E3N88_42620 [Mikania micrantha]
MLTVNKLSDQVITIDTIQAHHAHCIVATVRRTQIRYDRDLVFYAGGHDGDGDTEEERGGAGEDDDMAARGRRLAVGIRNVSDLLME